MKAPPIWLEALCGLVLVAVACLFMTAPAANAANAHDATSALLIAGPKGTVGECSGTHVLTSHVILSAAHCFHTKLLKVDGKPAKVLAAVNDGHDHVLLKTDQTFAYWAPIDFNAPVTFGTRVHYWGNPNWYRDLYREGYFSGVCDLKTCMGNTELRDMGAGYIIDAHVGPGDSGAGLFDEKGTVIGVVSGRTAVDEIDYLPLIAVPFNFTPAQIQEVM